jgi:hypothetical protein
MSPSAGLKWQGREVEGLYRMWEAKAEGRELERTNRAKGSGPIGSLQEGYMGGSKRRDDPFEGPPEGVMFLFRACFCSPRSWMTGFHDLFRETGWLPCHFSPEDVDSMFLWNDDIDIQNHTVPKSKTTSTSVFYCTPFYSQLQTNKSVLQLQLQIIHTASYNLHPSIKQMWVNNLYFGILGWIYINKFYIYPSPPLNENKLIQLAQHVSI